MPIVGLACAMIIGGAGLALAAPTGTQNAGDLQGSTWQKITGQQSIGHQNGWKESSPQAVRATEAPNLLEAKGYGQFSDFKAVRHDFTADVTKGGQIMHVLIKPDVHQIEQVEQAG
jgi:hypothetical protein